MRHYPSHREKVCRALSVANNSIHQGWVVPPETRPAARDVHFEISQLLECYKSGKIDMEAINQALIDSENNEEVSVALCKE